MAKGWKAVFWILIAFVLATFAYHKYEMCGQCGAVRHVYLTTLFWPNLFVERREISETCERLLGKQCPHTHCEPLTVWFFILHGDWFPRLPLAKRGTIENIQRLPESAWQRQAVLAIGAKDNLLKWVVVMVLFDSQVVAPDSREQWNTWWATNKEVFEVVTDIEQARAVAERAVRRSSETDSWGYDCVEYDLQEDLGPLEATEQD